MQRTGEVKFRAFFYHFLHLICKSEICDHPLTGDRRTSVYLRSSFTSETGLEFELRYLGALPVGELVYVLVLKCGAFVYIFMCVFMYLLMCIFVYICGIADNMWA